MAQHRGQACFIAADRQDPGVNPHFSAWKAEGVGFLAVEHDEFPLRSGQIGHGGDAFADLLNQLVGLGIPADRDLFLHLSKRGQAQLHLVGRRKNVDLATPRFLDRLAPGRQAQNGNQHDDPRSETGRKYGLGIGLHVGSTDQNREGFSSVDPLPSCLTVKSMHFAARLSGLGDRTRPLEAQIG